MCYLFLNCDAKVMVIFEINNIFARKLQKKMRKMVIGIGNALVDALVQVPNDEILTELELPKGSMQLIDTDRYQKISKIMAQMDVKRSTGGSASNTILALANLNASPAFIGKVSDDENGRFFADNCKNLGINAHLLSDTLPTGVASTFISADGQRTFGTYLGAAARLTADDMRKEWFEGYDYFYIEGYLVQNHDLIECAVDMAHEAGLKVCLDLASYNIVEEDRDFFEHLLRKTDMVFANEEEARAFTGKEPREALDELAQLCHLAVVKVGKDGAMARCGENFATQTAMSVNQVVDTTAAGDFFAAGFLYAHALDRDLQACLYAGSILSGHVIQIIGSKLSDEVWQNIKQELQ